MAGFSHTAARSRPDGHSTDIVSVPAIQHAPIKFIPAEQADWTISMPRELADRAEHGGKHRDDLRFELALLWRQYVADGEFSISNNLLDELYTSTFRRKLMAILHDTATPTRSHSNYHGWARCRAYRFNLTRPKKAPTYNGIHPDPDDHLSPPRGDRGVKQVRVTVSAAWLHDRYERWSVICERNSWVQHLDLDGRTDWGRQLFTALQATAVPVTPETARLTEQGVVKAARRKHGRCYHSLINLRKDLRRQSLLGGEPTAEVDIHAAYSALLISMLPDGDAKDGAIAALQGDWYAQFGDAYQEWLDSQLADGKAYKDTAGRWMMRVDDDSAHDVPASIKVEYQRQCLFWRDGRDASNPLRVTLRQLHPELCQLIEGWRRRMSPTELSAVLTRAEGSLVVDYAMSELERAGIAAIPIHDAVVVAISQAHAAREILLGVAEWHLGFRPKISIKGRENMKHSKIEITDRLRQLDLWDEGSLFKDACKRRLMAEGMSRKDSGELAWEETARVFEIEFVDCPDAPMIAAWAEFPPLVDEGIADQAGEPQFNLVWRLWCYLQAKQECLKSGSAESIEAIDDRIAQAGADAGDEDTTVVARDNVGRFLQELAIPKLLAVVQRLEAAGDDDDDEDVEELLEHVEAMSRFKASVEADRRHGVVGIGDRR